MRQKNTFELWPQSINRVQDDLVLLCCEPSTVVGGYVGAMFLVKDPTTRPMTETMTPHWGLPTFAGDKFVLQPHTVCPWCRRDLPPISVPVDRDSVN